ncbi:TonB-dependent receptor domain-containing protein [Pedobacter alpinus]|uniref:TonB-dependent receptor domain-containing protein n=1 Tax=Pedobacter alpinus TaxID=1590643 RepID=A0ABW5TML6_9SPHI
MKFSASFALLFIITFFSFAQTNITQNLTTITGTATEDKSGAILEFATVSLVNPIDGKILKGGQTDLNGKFTFQNIETGTYNINVSFVGYSNFSQSVIVNGNSKVVDLGKLKIKKSSTSLLNEVVVTAKKDVIELGIDRKIFNTDQSLVTQGGNATDLLATVPSVQVDLDGNISLRGTSSVRVLIDGKPSTFGGGNITTILQSLPASAIERVELITNPSAKYDPEGQSGIINIVLKKNQRIGLNGNVAVTAGRFNNFNTNTGLNYRDEKWNLSGNYSYRAGDRPGFGKTNTTFLNTSTQFAPFSFSDQVSNSNDKSHTLKLGVERYLSEATSVSLSGNLSLGKENDRDDLRQRFLDANRELIDFGVGYGTQIEDGNGYDLNLDFSHKFKKPNEELIGNFSFGRGAEDQTEDIVQSFFDNNGNTSTRRIGSSRFNDVAENTKTYNLQLDYTLPMSESAKFEIGYRSILKRNTENQISDTLLTNSTVLDRDFTQSSLFELEDIVHAIYTNYQNQLTKNFGIQVGLRTEQAYLNTTVTGTDASNAKLVSYNPLDYLRVYPSVFLTQKFKGDNQLQLSYSRRVNRPRGYQTNPFPDRSDRYNIRVGNPNLRPEDIHSFELGYAKILPLVTFTSSIYFRQVNDVVQSIRDNNPDEIGGTIARYFNLAQNQSFGLELISRADVTKNFNLTGNLNFFQSYFSGGGNLGINDNSGFNWNGNLTGNLNITKSLSAQTSAFYSAPRVLSQGEMLEMLSVDAGLKQDFFTRKASLSFNIRDIFNTRQFGLITDNGIFIQDWSRRRAGRVYSFTLSYRFGSQPQVKGKRPSNMPEEDMGF